MNNTDENSKLIGNWASDVMLHWVSRAFNDVKIQSATPNGVVNSKCWLMRGNYYEDT